MATSIFVKVPVGLLLIVVVVSVSAVVTACLFTVILGIPDMVFLHHAHAPQ